MFKINPPISYQGSKRRHIKKITEYEPKEFSEFYDIYGGGGAVSLHYLTREDVETNYNDLCPRISGFFKQLKSGEGIDEFINSYNRLKYDDETFKQQHAILKADPNNLTAFIYLTHTAFRSNFNSKMMDKKKEINKETGEVTYTITGKRRDISYLKDYKEALKDLNIDNRNALDILKEQQYNENAFIYLDPPYYSSDCANYSVNTYEDMQTIEKIIKDPKTKAKIMLHCEFQGYIYCAFKDYIKDVHDAKYNMKSGTNTRVIPKKYMCIITNYNITPDNKKEE